MLSSNLIIALGIWRAALVIPGAEIPFNFTVEQCNSGYCFVIQNGTERIVVDDIKKNGDSLVLRFPVFDSEIRAWAGEDSMAGVWINHARKSNKQIPFYAVHRVKDRFFLPENAQTASVKGKWEVHFSPGKADDNLAIGLFSQEGTKAYGTFLTPTGDYRFLEGIAVNDSLYLSCFDGSHAFLFRASIKGDAMHGTFLSGKHWKESWTAKRNNHIELPHPDSLTFLNEGYEKLEFAFPGTDSVMVRLSDPSFKNKVKVIQVLGSWCPNCIDESAFLAEAYDAYPRDDFEIIGLAFEKTSSFQQSVSNINKLKAKLGMRYPVLIAGTREESRQKLPMINKLMAYPTTFFVDRQNRIRKVHTGFYGPATGAYYEKFSDDFHAFILKLLSEK